MTFPETQEQCEGVTEVTEGRGKKEEEKAGTEQCTQSRRQTLRRNKERLCNIQRRDERLNG